MNILAGFPRQISVSSRSGAQSYTLVPDHYAIHGLPPGSPSPNAAYRLDNGTIAIHKGSPDHAVAQDRLSAVYALAPGGSLAVPTGLVFIRLAEGLDVRERSEEIKNAGYEMAETLTYAPNAAWLRPRSGSIADALAGLSELKKIPSVESVEPQMLMEGARR